mmetsp:Transcript_57071/g.105504  ORF Transcript_57071/g.105504 Transcript_57071/m.105504 type:complete len:220 (-) Transcript_57071:191-850(-)
MASSSSCPLGFGGAKSSTAQPDVKGESKQGSQECPVGAGAASVSQPASSSSAPGVDNLSRDREVSSIPCTTGDNFMYPSERQFFTSATAKGHELDPNDMSMVVAIHNAVNERAWQEILRFESLHATECAVPTLSRFIGRPGDISPKARLLGLFGRSAPFDRHDWHIDRCGQKIRYLVDFYDGKPSAEFPVSIYVDARPEVSFGGLRDRLTLWAKGTGLL